MAGGPGGETPALGGGGGRAEQPRDGPPGGGRGEKTPPGPPKEHPGGQGRGGATVGTRPRKTKTPKAIGGAGTPRDPATGEPIQIKASKKVAFRAAKELKESV